jgi:hypothetical protein
MGRKAKAGRSFFSNLPLDLRSSLRSQTLVPLIPGANINDLELKQEALDKVLGPGNDYLPTQPASPGSSDDVEDRAEVVAVAESSTSARKRQMSNEVDLDIPDSSVVSASGQGQGKKQKHVAGKPSGTPTGTQPTGAVGSGNSSASAKGKGKGKGKEVNGDGTGPGSKGNRFKGHRWDCTGLVKRYKKPSEMPSELVKCECEGSCQMGKKHAWLTR